MVLFAPVAVFVLVSFFAGLNERSFEDSLLFAVLLLILPLDWALERVLALKFWDRYSSKFLTASMREGYAGALLFAMLLSLDSLKTADSLAINALQYVAHSIGYGMLFIGVSAALNLGKKLLFKSAQ